MNERKRVTMSAAEAARCLGGEVQGNPEAVLSGVRPLDQATATDLAFAHGARYRAAALASEAGVILTNGSLDLGGRTVIVVGDVNAAYRQAIALFYPETPVAPGVSPQAVIEPTVTLGEAVHVGPGAILAAGVVLGDRTVIMPGAIVGAGCEIGCDCVLYPGVVLYPNVTLGDRVVLHANAVIGAAGFGFHKTPDGSWARVPHVGRVVIEDDVELGAGTCVDQATFTETRVGRGTKMDNQVQIGHNVVVEEDCLIIAQVAVGGSTRIGAGCSIGGQTAVVDHLHVGPGTTLLVRSCLMDDTPPNSEYGGFPAVEGRLWRKIHAASLRLPQMLSTLRRLGRQLGLDDGAQGG